jgi:hypothetical protein
MVQVRSRTDFPDSVLEKIDSAISFNATIRSLTFLIPGRQDWGKDCIKTHNAIIRKIYNEPNLRLGSKIVGSTSTHQILKLKGRAGPLKIFLFWTKRSKKAIGHADADRLMESIGGYVVKNYSGQGVSIYGVSVMDGYHSMTLTYRKKNKESEFYLIDQGPGTSLLTGKFKAKTPQELDEALNAYVRSKKDVRIGDTEYQYPATIGIYRIYPDTIK